MKSLRIKPPAGRNSSPRPQLADSEEPMLTHYELIGIHEQARKVPVLFIRHPGAPPAEAIAVPLTLCTTSKHSMLEEHLMKAGFMKALNSTPSKAIAAQFREFAATTQVRVLDSEGIHKLTLSGVTCCVLVKAGTSHWLTSMPEGAAVVLVGKACSTDRRSRSHKRFKKVFGVLLRGSPRLLAVLLFALAAWLASEFGVAALALALVGPSSIGKTIIQRAASLLVDGRDRVRHFDGTTQGVIEFIQAVGASAVYFEDAHGAKVSEALCSAIMAAGNGSAERMRSSHAQRIVSEATTRATLVWSAEASLADTVRSGQGVLRSGLYARLLEVYPGQHGMFDDLCGQDSAAELSRHVEVQSRRFAGVVGQAFAEAIAGKWDRLHKQWNSRRAEVKSGILGAAGVDEPDGVTDRLAEALTFVGFVGAIASNYGVLPVMRSDVYEALGLLLREQVDRLQGARTPVAQEAIEAVRHYLQTNRARFQPIESAGEPTQVNGLAGYIKRSKGTAIYLFFPKTFRDLFVSKYGEEVFAHLRAAGYLISQSGRENRYQARIPTPGQEGRHARLDFVAISEAILFAED